jgi:SAM-dependent methyltransferase
MLSRSATRLVETLEASANDGMTIDDILTRLRPLGLRDFGALFISLPNPNYPKLSAQLPRMASDQVQLNWTGNTGYPLFLQTHAFVDAVAAASLKYRNRPLNGARMLDFGCGYGRIARLMYYYSNYADVIGVDPWDESIRICREDGLGDNFIQSEYLPKTLPVNGHFDFIYAFSVFTHTSERVTRTCLNTLIDYLAPGGLAVITIRPVDYWAKHNYDAATGNREVLVADHNARGFAFLPHDRAPIDGEVVYGDTSMTIDWLEAAVPSLKICGTERPRADPLQVYVYLQRRQD